MRPKGNAKKAAGAKTKQAILDAALELYAKDGWRGTGLTAVGERAGVTHASVLYHFGSSSKLLVAVIDERERLFLEDTIDAWAEGGLRALANLPAVARWNVEHEGLARLFTVLEAENLDPDDEAHEHFLVRSRLLRDLLRQQMQAAVDAGDVRADVDVTTKADEIVAFMDGAQLQYALDPERIDLVAVYESYTDALLRDLRA
jgi:AcrR family transcriptional regulator